MFGLPWWKAELCAQNVYKRYLVCLGTKKNIDLGFLCSIYLQYQASQTHYNVSLQSIWTQLQFSHSLNEHFKRFDKLDIFFWKLIDLTKNLQGSFYILQKLQRYCIVISRQAGGQKPLILLPRSTTFLASLMKLLN